MIHTPCNTNRMHHSYRIILYSGDLRKSTECSSSKRTFRFTTTNTLIMMKLRGSNHEIFSCMKTGLYKGTKVDVLSMCSEFYALCYIWNISKLHSIPVGRFQNFRERPENFGIFAIVVFKSQYTYFLQISIKFKIYYKNNSSICKL